MPFSPERARPPGAHSFTRRARPELQPAPAVPTAALRGRSATGAKWLERKTGRGRPPRRNGDGLEPISTSSARRQSARRLPPRGLGLSRLLSPTPGPSGLESPSRDARPRPGAWARAAELRIWTALELSSGALSYGRRAHGKGWLG